jgi:hypothetical protein
MKTFSMKNLLVRASGNGFAQRLLERNVKLSQFLMGIGSGAGVQVSGENAALALLGQICKPPYCIFDIGANRGQYLNLISSTLVTTPHVVHCFDPGSKAFEQLQKNASLYKDVKLNNVALSKASGGEMTLHNSL